MSYSQNAKSIASKLVLELSSKLDLSNKLKELPSTDFRNKDVFLIIGDLETNLKISESLAKFNTEINLDTISTNTEEAANNIRAMIAAENPTQNLDI